MLEPYEGKLSRTVLRGERYSNIPDLLDRPDQLIQRNGRILRQGNENKEVEIFNYITEGSFDSYLYQILENKQKFISQVMTEKSPLRACDDIDEVVLTYAEIKGLAMKNPFMKEKMQVETEINKINLLKGNWLDNKEKYKIRIEDLPTRIESLTKSIEKIKLDIETYKTNKDKDFEITLNNTKFEDRTKAGEYFMQLKTKIERDKNANDIQEVGIYGGFKVAFTTTMTTSKIYLIGNKTYEKDLGASGIGNMTRIENLANDIENELPTYENRLNELKKELELLKEEIKKPFEYDERLNYLLKRKIEIDYNIENGITEETNQLNIDDIASVPVENNVKVVEPIEIIESKENDLGKKLYNQLYDWGYSVLDNKEDYIELNATGFDRLVLECIDENEYSLAHYSELNGDAMRSPEITFIAENGSIEPTSYLDDYLGEYQSYEELQESPNLISSLKDFLNGWLTNISTQFQLAIQELKKQKNEIQQENLTNDNTLIKEKVYENNIDTEKVIYDDKDIPVDKIREMYPVGTMIMLENMQNENLPRGTIGQVKKVDDIGQIHTMWQNGSSLALNIKVDKFKVLNNENNQNIENRETEKSSEYEQDMEEI